MKALTVHQPWATLIARHGKDIENRSWAPPPAAVGEPLAIHASLRWDKAGEQAAREILRDAWPVVEFYPQGGVIAVVTLQDHHGSHACVRLGTLSHLHPDGPYRCSRWAMGGANDLGPTSHWVMADPIELRRVVACRGRQRLWTLPPDVAEQVAAQLAEVDR